MGGAHITGEKYHGKKLGGGCHKYKTAKTPAPKEGGQGGGGGGPTASVSGK